jgi:hypothetical protein
MSRFQVAILASQNRDWGTVEAEWKKVTDQYPNLFTGQNIGTFVNPGWWVALDAAFKEMDALVAAVPGAVFNVAQIKEKFGGLRFYFDVTRADIDADDDNDDGTFEVDGDISELRRRCYEVVERAEVAVEHACEYCGEPGQRRTDLGWLKTLCDVHHQEAKAAQTAKGR